MKLFTSHQSHEGEDTFPDNGLIEDRQDFQFLEADFAGWVNHCKELAADLESAGLDLDLWKRAYYEFKKYNAMQLQGGADPSTLLKVDQIFEMFETLEASTTH